ncbi:MAG: DNA-methyltransferase [Candidatus Hodarchaeales archaeon]|jgi:DNA modification methylase
MKDEILIGDVDDCLLYLEDNSIDCAVTSPPYWSQRDYEFDGQIGKEETFTDYCLRLTRAFSILRQKMTDKGVFFLNIGDKYLSKYGNTPLAMIPFVLSYYLELDGWHLDDTIAWYKPNHMPSSIKNRFTNTYEPVFVLAKNSSNYHSEYRLQKQREGKYSKVLKIKLQPTPHKHMAVYPEKLVEALVTRGIPPNSFVCDPFAGSGTTGKAIRNLNGFNLSTMEKIKRSFIIIEGNENYLDILLERTALKKEDVVVIDKSTTDRKYVLEKPVVQITNKYQPEPHREFLFTKSTARIMGNDVEKEQFFQTMISKKAFDIFPDPGIMYIGISDISLEDYYHLSQLNDHGWIIRNMIVCTTEGNSWFPIFFIVKDQKRVRYRFNLDNIRIAHKSDWGTNWKEIDFMGFEIVDNFTFKNRQRKGTISVIDEYHEDGMPKHVNVEWEDGTITSEHVTHVEEWWDTLEMRCPLCSTGIADKEEFFYQLICQSCDAKLWKNLETIPVMREKDRDEVTGKLKFSKRAIEEKNGEYYSKKEYTGKFAGASRINMGQSPAARAATQDMFFSVIRKHGMQQDLVADILNYYREKAGLSKKEVTDKFPPEYFHTVGHWLRKDMGGSIPLPEDLEKLAGILDLPSTTISILSARSLKLQTVKKAAKGKNPGDYLEGSLESIMDLLKMSMK